MTANDRMKLLREKVAELGQAQVARDLGYSASAISQVLHGKYQGSLDNLLERVAEVYGSDVVSCPVLGDIPLGRCSEERRKPFAATNAQRVRQWRACQNCPKNRR